ncbi:YidC/Oxa1 family membrane protein insertase [Candidatus Peregrinibacteria bacterium]|nr:YidC/Oxa1 family membrane protein insertase [Candidatus Peregrinibacteria bacterium]
MMQRFLRMALIFFVAYFALSLLFPNPNKKTPETAGDVVLTMEKTEVAQGNLVKGTVQNNTEVPLVLGEKYSPPEYLIFERYENGKWESVTPKNPTAVNTPTKIDPHSQASFSFSEFNEEMFFPIGKYRVLIRPDSEHEFVTEFNVFEPGILRTLFRAVYKVIYNIFIVFLMVGWRSLGLAIILITVLIKMLLWGLNQKSLESQKKMQKIQPELEHLKIKYKDDQQKLAQETMALWKKSGVNPLAAMTPIFIQFPVLIALFYVIRDGLLPHDRYLLYPIFKNFDFSGISNVFLWIFDLSKKPNEDMRLIWLPFVVAILQFLTMRLTFKKNEKKQKETPKKEDSGGMADQMQMMNKMMIYFLPVMIFYFTLTFPSGIGMYWGISTLITLGQQWILNKKHDAE